MCLNESLFNDAAAAHTGTLSEVAHEAIQVHICISH